MKGLIRNLVLAALGVSMLAGCGGNDKISVVSREEGSGTRGAFVELTHVLEKNAQGKKIDNTTQAAEITNSTSVMITTVKSNKNAIGYISLGSLNDQIKAVKIDGVIPTVDNTKSGAYKIRRPFILVLKNGVENEVIKDLESFILSKEGQAIVAKKGYVPVDTNYSYASKGLSGKLSIAGSSSVTPVMESLKEAYIKLNPSVTLEIQQSDSTTGVTTVIEGVSNIGMSSRELTEAEKSKGAVPLVIALDGIAVIVNKENKVDSLSVQNVKDIYTGKTVSWSELTK
ncbi:MAG: substrate-binding domain-containing protein [Succinivibrionaceae bacterium]|nr:substrate-binding domain-containing protein [Ruminobacter sp.]MEE1340695.1 substrate-binding domain-containing protein [Succinivibrionaceae bacterium]